MDCCNPMGVSRPHGTPWIQMNRGDRGARRLQHTPSRPSRSTTRTQPRRHCARPGPLRRPDRARALGRPGAEGLRPRRCARRLAALKRAAPCLGPVECSRERERERERKERERGERKERERSSAENFAVIPPTNDVTPSSGMTCSGRSRQWSRPVTSWRRSLPPAPRPSAAAPNGPGAAACGRPTPLDRKASACQAAALRLLTKALPPPARRPAPLRRRGLGSRVLRGAAGRAPRTPSAPVGRTHPNSERTRRGLGSQALGGPGAAARRPPVGHLRKGLCNGADGA